MTRISQAIAALALLGLGACAGGPPGEGPHTASLAPNMRVPEARELMGQRPEKLRVLLGEPSLLRKEGEAQMWQYRTASCVLFLFLYPDAGGAYSVSHLEASPTDPAAQLTKEAAASSCLEAVARARAAGQGVS